MRQAGEPSVEEILESIKKVIARDNRAEAAQQRARRDPAATEPPRPLRVHEVLELTDLADSDAPAAGEGATDTAAKPASDRAGDAAPPAAAVAPLVAAPAEQSMRDALAALAVLAEPGAAPQIVRSGETSLEGLTRDLLRPMLAEWLDRHLPGLVERLVAAEIARIAGKRG